MSAPAPFDSRRFLTGLFWSMVDAAGAQNVVPAHLPPPPKGRTVVVGAGKAAAAMARVVDERWQGELSGVVVTRYGHGLPCVRIEVLEAGHPHPDQRSVEAAGRVLAAVRDLSADDLVLVLLSGGGSALLTLPAPGLTLEDLRETNRQLLLSGAGIEEINCVRKHLTALAGGRLAAACYPARVLTLAISDVPGNDPTVIASGPTVADPTTLAEARAVFARHRLRPPAAVRRYLQTATQETLKPGDPRLSRSEYVVVATPETALAKAAQAAEAAAVAPVLLGTDWQLEAREVARLQARLVCEAATHSERPLVFLSGGESTVTVRGPGRGGRNTEYLLALALALREVGCPRFAAALAADTDGFDGTEENAGAYLFRDSMERAAALGLDPRRLLQENDSHRFFARLGDLLVTGPTRTNVNDLRAVLVL
jgi:glycerate 2-kinase